MSIVDRIACACVAGHAVAPRLSYATDDYSRDAKEVSCLQTMS